MLVDVNIDVLIRGLQLPYYSLGPKPTNAVRISKGIYVVPRLIDDMIDLDSIWSISGNMFLPIQRGNTHESLSAATCVFRQSANYDDIVNGETPHIITICKGHSNPAVWDFIAYEVLSNAS